MVGAFFCVACSKRAQKKDCEKWKISCFIQKPKAGTFARGVKRTVKGFLENCKEKKGLTNLSFEVKLFLVSKNNNGQSHFTPHCSSICKAASLRWHCLDLVKDNGFLISTVFFWGGGGMFCRGKSKVLVNIHTPESESMSVVDNGGRNKGFVSLHFQYNNLGY
jgi:hypothetical protein